MNDLTTTEDAVEKAEQYEALKQILLRLLDDPQVQQKLVSIIRNRLGATSKAVSLRGRPPT